MIISLYGHRYKLHNMKWHFRDTYPPASEASREVANLTERKNPHTPVHGVKECLSVCGQL